MQLALLKPDTRDRNNICAWPCLPRSPWHLILLQLKALACQEEAAATRQFPGSVAVLLQSTSSPPFWSCLQVPALWTPVGASGGGISPTLYPRLPSGGPVCAGLCHQGSQSLFQLCQISPGCLIKPTAPSAPWSSFLLLMHGLTGLEVSNSAASCPAQIWGTVLRS